MAEVVLAAEEVGDVKGVEGGVDVEGLEDEGFGVDERVAAPGPV